ncbi:MAG TPA: hypothetical protein VF571_16925 [Pyrinomonadaceae bacterium]|jgi:hypothetical protein
MHIINRTALKAFFLTDSTPSEALQNHWFGSGELIEPPPPIQDRVSRELEDARDADKLNPLLQPTSERAYNVAKSWVNWVRNRFTDLSVPYVIVSGDGGVIIEWQAGGNFVSVNFDESDSEMDTIFFRISTQQDTVDFNEVNLEELLSELTTYEVISADYVTRESARFNRCSREFYFNLAGTASATHNLGERLGS